MAPYRGGETECRPAQMMYQIESSFTDEAPNRSPRELLPKRIVPDLTRGDSPLEPKHPIGCIHVNEPRDRAHILKRCEILFDTAALVRPRNDGKVMVDGEVHHPLPARAGLRSLAGFTRISRDDDLQSMRHWSESGVE